LPFAFEEIAFSAISSKALFSGSDVSIRTFLTFFNEYSAISLTIFIYGFSSFKKENNSVIYKKTLQQAISNCHLQLHYNTK